MTSPSTGIASLGDHLVSSAGDPHCDAMPAVGNAAFDCIFYFYLRLNIVSFPHL